MVSKTTEECNVYLFEIIKGDDFAYKSCFINKDTQVPINITNWEFVTTLKSHFNLPDSKASLKIVSGPLTGSSALQGEMYTLFKHEDTVKLAPTTYYLDIKRIDRGMINTVVAGKIRIIGDMRWRKQVYG